MDILKIYSGVITSTQTSIFTGKNNLIKTILIGNSTDTDQNLNLIIDSMYFTLYVEANTTKIIDNSIMCSSLSASADTALSLHITGYGED